MTVPRGMFVPGARQGLAASTGRATIPKEWLKAHPATRRWMASMTLTTPLTQTNTTALDLSDGFEGLIEHVALRRVADLAGGTGGGPVLTILINSVAVFQSLVYIGTSNPSAADQSGGFDYLHEGDGAGNSWGMLDLPIEENGIVGVGLSPVSSNVAGWSMFGIYWPVTLREEWLMRGWRK